MKAKKSRKLDFVVTEVPHSRHRYPTVGDWIPGKPVEIRVSKMDDERYVFLVALHELIEYELCRMKGVGDAEVVKFDKKFEAERIRGLHNMAEEPGEDPRAPYRAEHMFATTIEKLVAQKLAVKWSDYEQRLLDLSAKRKIAVKQFATPHV
ncbi:MAG: hypothetical protein OK422_06600 [Thaumarchaeota archaeon]|nr:hypothetical protein [Nitrososphaerota archaeon]